MINYQVDNIDSIIRTMLGNANKVKESLSNITVESGFSYSQQQVDAYSASLFTVIDSSWNAIRCTDDLIWSLKKDYAEDCLTKEQFEKQVTEIASATKIILKLYEEVWTEYIALFEMRLS